MKSEDGGATWSDPVKVADFFDLPDCFEYTGFDAGVACVPTAPLSGTSIFRATNYPTGVAPDDDTVVIDFGSYINPHSNPDLGNCTPDGFTAVRAERLHRGRRCRRLQQRHPAQRFDGRGPHLHGDDDRRRPSSRP